MGGGGGGGGGFWICGGVWVCVEVVCVCVLLARIGLFRWSCPAVITLVSSGNEIERECMAEQCVFVCVCVCLCVFVFVCV